MKKKKLILQKALQNQCGYLHSEFSVSKSGSGIYIFIDLKAKTFTRFFAAEKGSNILLPQAVVGFLLTNYFIYVNGRQYSL